MSKNDYILRHDPRAFVKRKCEVLKKNKENVGFDFFNSYDVVIAVDPPNGNQDPYVFNAPWVHAYCHINQLKKDTGNQSILIWGSWDQKTKKSNFFVDTIFVVDRKFSWNGDEPSEELKNYCPYKKSEGIYTNLFKYKSQKSKTDRIYIAKHYDNQQPNPENRSDEHYSFIPLKYNNGYYELIDILPMLKERDNEFCIKMSPDNGKESGIRNINFGFSIIKYIYENADILVTKVLDNEPFNTIDEELQEKYFPLVYGIEYNKNTFKNCSYCEDLDE